MCSPVGNCRCTKSVLRVLVWYSCERVATQLAIPNMRKRMECWSGLYYDFHLHYMLDMPL